MTVIIEELDAEVTPPTLESRSERPAQVQPPDQRTLLSAIEYEEWLRSRVMAD